MIKNKIKVFKKLIYSFNAKYLCPICNSRIRNFQPLPKFYQNNAKKYGYRYHGQAETLNYHNYSCPLCGASDRDRLYALYIKDYFGRTKQDVTIKVIDFAPSSPLSHFIRALIAQPGKNVSYITADIKMEDVDYKVNIADMNMFNDNQFDFFICSHVLEHVSDDRKALSELYRILKPLGLGILMVPINLGVTKIDEDPYVIDESEKWRRFGQYDHVRIYSKDGFLDRVKASGFIVHQYGKEFFGENIFAQNGITNQSILYVVEK